MTTMPWATLRPGLLADLGFDNVATLAETIDYDDVQTVERALAGETPTDEFMTALLRHYLNTPPLYFVRSAA